VPCCDVRDNARTLIVATKSAAFVSACANDRSVFGRCYKKAAQWLANLTVSIPLEDARQSSPDLTLLFSSSLEALARLSLIALDSSVGPEMIEPHLIKVRSAGSKFLLENPSSICGLKSVSVYCIALKRFSKHLSDEANTIFEALTPNLYDPAQLKRQHTLQIMATVPKKPFVTDHADLDLSEDLDEEPTSTGYDEQKQEKKGLVGSCDIIETLLQIESLPLDLTSERPMVSLLSRIEIFGRAGKLPIVYAEAVTAHLMGLLHVKFSPVCGTAIKTLAAIARLYERTTWGLIFSRLSALMEDRCPRWSRVPRAPSLSDRVRSGLAFFCSWIVGVFRRMLFNFI
jgi:hypothetical protein